MYITQEEEEWIEVRVDKVREQKDAQTGGKEENTFHYVQNRPPKLGTVQQQQDFYIKFYIEKKIN